MTDQSLRAAARAFGTLLADIGGREALRALGVLGPTPGPPVLCVLASTTLAEAQESAWRCRDRHGAPAGSATGLPPHP